MYQIKTFIITLIALSAFLGIIKFLFPKGALSGPLKLICGLIAITALAAPIKGIVESTYSFDLFQSEEIYQSRERKDAEDLYEERVFKLSEIRISEDAAAYLLEEYGVSADRIETVLDENGSVEYMGIVLTGNADKDKIDTNDIKERYGAKEVKISPKESG